MQLLEWMISSSSQFRYSQTARNLQTKPYLRGIYECSAPQRILCGARGMGMTEYALNLALFTCSTSAANVLYILPNQREAHDLRQFRFVPALSAAGITAVGVRDGNANNLKIGEGGLLLSGRWGDNMDYHQLRGFSPNVMICDGTDDSPRFIKQLSNIRTLKETLIMGSTRGYSRGIYRRWRNSDRRQWHVKCEGCGGWQMLRPGNLAHKWNGDRTVDDWNYTADGKIFFSCTDCGKPLNRQGKGEWVAEKPDRNVAGFLLSQAINPEYDIYLLAGGLVPRVHINERRWCLNGLWGLPCPKPRAFDRFVLGRRDHMMWPYTTRRPRHRLIPRQNGRRMVKKQEGAWLRNQIHRLAGDLITERLEDEFARDAAFHQTLEDAARSPDIRVVKRSIHGGSNE